MPLVPLARDKGYHLRQILEGLEDAVRQASLRNGQAVPAPAAYSHWNARLHRRRAGR